MSRKQLSFLEQADALERENKRLREILGSYQKLADAVVKAELGMDLKTLKKTLEQNANCHSEGSIFEEIICNYFGLKTELEKDAFLKIILCDNIKSFFYRNREKKEV